MNLRIDYTWVRYEGAAHNAKNHDFMVDSEAPEIKTKADAAQYLRDWADGWTGYVSIEVISISDSFINETIDEISEQISGQQIDVENGQSVFKRAA